MNIGNPKPKRVKLETSEYRKFKIELYNRAKESCEICERWVALDQCQVHHIKHRWQGDDTPDNCLILCWQCHRRVHDGQIKG